MIRNASGPVSLLWWFDNFSKYAFCFSFLLKELNNGSLSYNYSFLIGSVLIFDKFFICPSSKYDFNILSLEDFSYLKL
jgi:hypothetical protein